MSPRTAINSEKGLRSPLFSQAIVCNGMVYVSGNIGMDYSKMELIQGSVADRTVRKYHAFCFRLLSVLTHHLSVKRF
jgi:enamine deaminase RidA (YjgF/YER057c/UK114 family)